MKEFVPPKVIRQHVWATYVEGRSPAFKVHSSEGLANAAISNHYPGRSVIKYNLVDGEWKEHTRFVSPTECEYCNGPLSEKTPWGSTRFGRYRPYGYKGRAFLQPVICRTCYTKTWEDFRRQSQEERERAEYERLKEKFSE